MNDKAKLPGFDLKSIAELAQKADFDAFRRCGRAA
jgi:hypothetical protein